MHRVKALARALVACLRFGIDQAHGRAVARLRLRRHVADRLMQQYGHARELARLRGLVQGNLTRGINARAELGNPLAVHEYPAALDVAVGLAARAQALFRHQLGNAHFFHGVPIAKLRLPSGFSYRLSCEVMTILEAGQIHKVLTGKFRFAPMVPAPPRAGTNG